MSRSRRHFVYRRLLGALLAAAVGCAAGFLYAQLSLPEGSPVRVLLTGGYATAGAAFGILALRLYGIAYSFWRD